jgi:hypothetical protein
LMSFLVTMIEISPSSMISLISRISSLAGS